MGVNWDNWMQSFKEVLPIVEDPTYTEVLYSIGVVKRFLEFNNITVTDQFAMELKEVYDYCEILLKNVLKGE